MDEREAHILVRLHEKLGDAFGEAHLLRVAKIAAEASQEALDGYPKGVRTPADDEVVSFMMSETNARTIGEIYLKPRGLHRAGPMIFSPDDLPTYIIGIGNG